MLATIAVVLLVLWLLGFFAFHVTAAFIHVMKKAMDYRAANLDHSIELTVAFLGAGSAWLHLPRRGRDVVAGALLVATVAAVAALALSTGNALVAQAVGTGTGPTPSPCPQSSQLLPFACDHETLAAG